MPTPIDAIAFDSFGTLFELEALQPRLGRLGLPEHATKLFFARLLRDALALEASGSWVPLRDIAVGSLETLCREHELAVSGDRIGAAVDGLSELPPYPDARPALERVQARGLPIAVLSNGSRATAERLLERAELRLLVAHVLSAEDAGHYKPHPAPYLAAASALGLPVARIGFVSAHAWDVHGARGAGLITAWVSRLEVHHGRHMSAPAVTAESLDGAVEALL